MNDTQFDLAAAFVDTLNKAEAAYRTRNSINRKVRSKVRKSLTFSQTHPFGVPREIVPLG